MIQSSMTSRDIFMNVYYSIFFNLVAFSHYWFNYEIKNILRHSFSIISESYQTEIIIDKNSYYSAGLIISGFIWPSITKKIGTKNALIFTFLAQGITLVLMGLSDNPMIIPIMFLFWGALLNIFNAGIAFVYSFCKPENAKFQFTSIVIVTSIFSKIIGLVGTWMYKATG